MSLTSYIMRCVFIYDLFLFLSVFSIFVFLNFKKKKLLSKLFNSI